MELKIKVWYVLLLVAVFILSFSWGGRKYKREVDSLSMALYEADRRVKDDSVFYTVKIDGLTRRVFEKEVKLVSTTRALKQSEIEKERLRKLRVKDVISISDLELAVDSLTVQLQGDKEVITIVDTVTKIPSNYLRLPYTAYYKDMYADIRLLVDRDTTEFMASIDIPITGTIGYKKVGMFKKELYSILDTPVPYVSVVKNNVVVVQDKKAWYERPSVYFIGGVLVGGFIVGL